MEVDLERIQELIQQPQESLSIELKAWIDPDQPEGVAKIVKTCLALRNHGGGYMVIGFDNDTLEQLFDGAPSNSRQIFHIDKIQGMVAKYSSDPFEVTVEFPRLDGQDFPVIIIPTGVKTPVAAKSDLSQNGNHLIRVDTVYVRSLSSNNTQSTTQAKSKDWNRLIEVCFDNREADIGRFIRRHLGSIGADQWVHPIGVHRDASLRDAAFHPTKNRYRNAIAVHTLQRNKQTRFYGEEFS